MTKNRVYDFAKNSPRVGRFISMISRHLRNHLDKKFMSLGLSSGTFDFMLVTYYFNGCNQEKLSTILQYDKGTTARALKKLEDGGFVKRIKDPADKRAYKITVTSKAAAIFDDVKRLMDEVNTDMLAGFSDEETKQLEGLLDRVAQNILGEEKYALLIQENATERES